MGNNGNIAKLFVPVHCINDHPQRSGKKLVSAFISCKYKHIYIANYFDYKCSNESLFEKRENIREGKKFVLGVISGEEDEELDLPIEIAEKIAINISIKESGIPECKLNKTLYKVLHADTTVIVLYDAQRLKNTCYLSMTDSTHELLSPLFWCVTIDNTIKSGSCKKNSNGGLENLKLKIRDISGNCVHLVQTVVKYLSEPFKSVLHIEKLCYQPAFCEQMRRKYDDGISVFSHSQQHKGGFHGIQMKNVLCRNGLDVVLGLLVWFWFSSIKDRNYLLAENTIYFAQSAASELQNLLIWMMGAPAGLKLNSQMAEFLGNFFLYHIYLWTAYLGLLRPVLSNALWYISMAGCLGLSIQIALVQDLFSMMTLHIYCFYVYAARLYNFQVAGLMSLWRFFRGKKWNSLRKRVDSAQYNVDQLFLGTLLFTILLFLLPTAVLFYAVFLTFRLVVLLIQGTLYKAISMINDIPVYFLLLKIYKPDTLINDVEFHVMRESTGSSYMVMELKSASVKQIFTDGKMKCTDDSRNKKHSWGSFMKKIIAGHLIYPWLDRN